jgi:hypothetical protein
MVAEAVEAVAEAAVKPNGLHLGSQMMPPPQG